MLYQMDTTKPDAPLEYVPAPEPLITPEERAAMVRQQRELDRQKESDAYKRAAAAEEQNRRTFNCPHCPFRSSTAAGIARHVSVKHPPTQEQEPASAATGDPPPRVEPTRAAADGPGANEDPDEDGIEIDPEGGPDGDDDDDLLDRLLAEED